MNDENATRHSKLFTNCHVSWDTLYVLALHHFCLYYVLIFNLYGLQDVHFAIWFFMKNIPITSLRVRLRILRSRRLQNEQEPPYLMRQAVYCSGRRSKQRIQGQRIIFKGKGPKGLNKNTLLLYFPYWPESQKSYAFALTWYMNLFFVGL